MQLENILESDFGRILSQDDGMTFSQIREQRACLYIGLSTQGYGQTALGIGKIFLNELLYNSYSSLLTEESKHMAKNKPYQRLF